MFLFSVGKKSECGEDSFLLPQRRRGRSRKVFLGFVSGGVVALILLAFISVCPCLSRDRAMRMDAQNNCRQITLAYTDYLTSEAHRLHPELATKPTSVSEFAIFLTIANPEINSAKLWFIPYDERCENLGVPIQVVSMPYPNGPSKLPVPETEFISAVPKSWAVVVNIPANAGPDYPIAWTRGLSGTGWVKDSPWRGKGGHVAFSNGSVCWFESTVDDETGKGVFADFKTGEPTSDIRAAIGPDARILEDQ